MSKLNQAEFESKAKKMAASYLGIDEKDLSMAWFRKVGSNEAVLCINVDPGPYYYYFDVLYLNKRGRYIMTVYTYEDCTFYDDELLLNEKQKNCPYCHEPFLDLSGKTGSEVDDDESAYCGTDDYGNLEYGASFDSGCVNKAEYVKIKYCPMCGRDLRSDEKFHQTYR